MSKVVPMMLSQIIVRKERKNMKLSVSTILIIILIASLIIIFFEMDESSAQKIKTDTIKTNYENQQIQIVNTCGGPSDQRPDESDNEDANRLLNKGFEYKKLANTKKLYNTMTWH